MVKEKQPQAFALGFVIGVLIAGLFALAVQLKDSNSYSLEDDTRFVIGYEMGYSAGSRNCIDAINHTDRRR